MDTEQLYKDIKARTHGEIYIGVVGPVRTGKSTFIKRFMDVMVLPRMEDEHMKEQTRDELPQSAAGKTIMTTEPKFVPKDAAVIHLNRDVEVKVRLIDCVGYLVKGASGYEEAGHERTAALLELLPEPKAFLQELNALGIPGVVTTAVRTEKCGICGTQLSVTVNGAEEESEDVPLAHTHACSHVHEHEHEHEHAHEHPHSHTGIADIRVRIAALPVPQRVRDNILAVYGRLAAAESEAHGRPVDQIHFHEVGTMDALADITAVCLLLERLAPEQIIVSPVHVGSGHVRCAHGILPVPAPATAILLRGVPIYGGHIVVWALNTLSAQTLHELYHIGLFYYNVFNGFVLQVYTIIQNFGSK